MQINLNKAAPLRINADRESTIQKYLTLVNKTVDDFDNFGDFFDFLIKQARLGLNVNTQLENNEAVAPLADNPYRTGNQAVDTYMQGLKDDNEQLTTENAQLKTDNAKLTEERNQAIQRTQEIYSAPFSQLDEASFKMVIDVTDNQIMPLLRKLTATPFLQLTPRQKFLLIWNYAVNDPIQQLLNIIPNLTDDQKALITDLQFPRQPDVQHIYGEFIATVKYILQKVASAEKQQIPLDKVLDPFEALIYNGYTAHYENQTQTHDTTEVVEEPATETNGTVIQHPASLITGEGEE